MAVQHSGRGNRNREWRPVWPFGFDLHAERESRDAAMRDLETGIVYVNAPTIGAETHLPFGGTKQTGNGHREAGTAALDFYSDWKTVYIDYSDRLQRAQIEIRQDSDLNLENVLRWTTFVLVLLSFFGTHIACAQTPRTDATPIWQFDVRKLGYRPPEHGPDVGQESVLQIEPVCFLSSRRVVVTFTTRVAPASLPRRR